MRAYYNEIDPNAAEWIRELIKDGLVTDGEVDERSIEDVLPADLRGFDRCHFFAGIAAWDYALNLAGWEGTVWTGSCPCQPFSTAGKRGGFDDERHLWPAWFHLIEICRPHTIFGEQVASKDGLTWLDLVSADVEGIGYTIGAVDIPAAGVGAPHKRQRFFFGVADARCDEPSQGRGNDAEVCRLPTEERRTKNSSVISGGGSADGDLAHAGCSELTGRIDAENGQQYRRGDARGQSASRGSNGVAQGDTNDTRPQGRNGEILRERPGELITRPPSPTNGFWSDAEWIYCRDEKYRATKPGLFPLADGVSGRVGLLRGAGNAISPWAAKAFIESWREVNHNRPPETQDSRLDGGISND